jgi:FKBP-type peptidyl-prolyl cis-trans isomerase FkpA
MKKAAIILVLFAMGLGCTNHKGSDESGMVYHVNKPGKTIERGDFTVLTYTERTEEGTVLYNSGDYDSRPVYKFRELSAFKGDFFSALGMLSEGDSATFKINLDSVLAKSERLKPQTLAKYLIYTIKVNKVIPRGELNDSLYKLAIETFKQKEIELAKQQEPAKIRSFIVNKNLEPRVTASGLNYILTKKGTGPAAVGGDSVEVYYTARYLSGKVFETNSETAAKKENIFNPLRHYGTAKFAVSKENPVSGFYEAAALFPAGTSVTLVIPSKLAYGAEGQNSIKPYTPIICDLEILKIIHPD